MSADSITAAITAGDTPDDPDNEEEPPALPTLPEPNVSSGEDGSLVHHL